MKTVLSKTPKLLSEVRRGHVLSRWSEEPTSALAALGRARAEGSGESAHVGSLGSWGDAVNTLASAGTPEPPARRGAL